jgi:hypothetical protein
MELKKKQLEMELEKMKQTIRDQEKVFHHFIKVLRHSATRHLNHDHSDFMNAFCMKCKQAK